MPDDEDVMCGCVMCGCVLHCDKYDKTHSEDTLTKLECREQHGQTEGLTWERREIDTIVLYAL